MNARVSYQSRRPVPATNATRLLLRRRPRVGRAALPEALLLLVEAQGRASHEGYAVRGRLKIVSNSEFERAHEKSVGRKQSIFFRCQHVLPVFKDFPVPTNAREGARLVLVS